MTWFCNNLQFFTYLFYQSYKHIQIFLFIPNQIPNCHFWMFYGSINVQNRPQKDPNLTQFALKYSIFIQFVYLFPKHVYMVLFTSDKAPWSFLNVFWLYLGPTLAKKGFYLTWYAEKCFLCIVNLLTKNLPILMEWTIYMKILSACSRNANLTLWKERWFPKLLQSIASCYSILFWQLCWLLWGKICPHLILVFPKLQN